MKYALAVTAILVLAAALRLAGIWFGLPHLYHWDEKMYYHGAFYTLATGGQTESLVYGNIPYILLPLMWVISLANGLMPVGEDLRRLVLLYLDDPTPFYLLGRIAWVALQLVAIYLIYVIGRNSLSRRAGLLGAFFASVAFLSVSEGHYVKGDSTAMLGATLVAWSAIHLVRQPTLKWYALLGAAIGISVAFKFYTYPLVLLPLVAHVLAWPIRQQLIKEWARLLLSAGLALVTLLLVLPAPLIDPVGTFEMFQIEAQATLASVPTGGVPVWLYYWTGHLWNGLGWPLQLCGLAGFGLWLSLAFARRDRERLLLLSVPILLWIGLVTRTNGFARYALPIVPFLALAAGDLLDWSATRLAARPGRSERTQKLLSPALAIVALLVALPTLLDSVRFGIYASSTNSRTEAVEWIEQNIPAGATIVVEGGQGFEAMSTLGPQLRPSPSAAGTTWTPTSLRAPAEFWSDPLLQWLESYTPTYQLTFAPSITRRKEITSTSQWGNPDAFVLISWRNDPEERLPPSPIWDDLHANYTLAARFDCAPCFPDDPYAFAVDYPTLASVDLSGGRVVAGPRVWVYTRNRQ